MDNRGDNDRVGDLHGERIPPPQAAIQLIKLR
jgi:hypothetical protein